MHQGINSSTPVTGSMLKLLPATALLLGTTFWFASAHSADGEFYAGFGLGSSQLDPDINDSEIDFGSGSFGGYKVFIGYDLTNNISLEGFFSDLGHVDIEYTPADGTANGSSSSTSGSSSTGSGLGTVTDDPNFPLNSTGIGTSTSTTADDGVYDGQLDYRVFGAQAVLQYPNNLPGFSGYGKLGVAQISTTSNGISWEKSNSSGVMAGLGVEYQMKNGVSVRAEYEFYDKEAQFVSLDLLKRFGRPAAAPPKLKVADSDDDGVRDVIDQCPGTAAGVAVNAAGCAKRKVSPPKPVAAPDPKLFDRDMDGVPDAKDLCLATMPGMRVDARGCDIVEKPAPVPVPVPAPAPAPIIIQEPQVMTTPAIIDQFTGVLEGVNFLVGSSRLTGEAKTILNQVAQDLLQYPNIHVTVVGHTDNSGSAAANKQLSESRALTVAEYLADQGVDPDRMKFAGKGEEEPVSSNATQAGRAKNRRVELIAREY